MTRTLALAALCLAPAAHAGFGAAWLNVPSSVRQAGFGDVSLGGDDPLAAWSNPATLAGQASRGMLVANGGAMHGGQRTLMGFGAGWRFSDRWSAGLLAHSVSESFMEVDELAKNLGETVGRRVMSGGAAAAFNAGRFQAGVGARGVADELLGETATAVALDAGLSVALSVVTLSAAVRNFGSGLRASDAPEADARSLPEEVRAGASVALANRSVLLAMEVVLPRANRERVGAGIEWWPVQLLGIRVGGPELVLGRGITAGLSVALLGFQLDYAVATHTLGPTHRMGLAWKYGPRAETAAPPAGPEPEPQALPVAAAPEAKRFNLAVSELAAQSVSPSDAAVISELLRGELISSRAFNVVEKANMDRILAEQAFQQSGCTTEECAVKLGRLLNVQRMVVGSFGKLLDEYFINIRVIDIETGRSIFGKSAKAATATEAERAVKDLVAQIVSETK